MLDFLEGFALGLTGLVPFLHTNFLVQFAGSAELVFVSALASSHLVFEAFPTVLFALPSVGHNVAALPGHQLALQGRAFTALRAMLHSVFFGAAFAVAFLPLWLVAAPLALPLAQQFSGYALLVLLALFYLSESKPLTAMLVFLLSGALGFLVFSTPLLAEPLFPLLSGLFAVPALLYSMGSEWPALREGEAFELPLLLVFLGALLGSLSPFLPAVNPALLASVAFLFLESAPLSFLCLASALAASKNVFDLVSSQTLGVARSGAAAAIAAAPLKDPVVVAVASFASVCAALAVAFIVFKPLALAARRVPMRSFNAFFVVFLAIANFLLAGWAGVFVLAVAACVGVLPIALAVRRSNAVGCLIFPSLAHFFALDAVLLAWLY